jgi:hypothetical protein
MADSQAWIDEHIGTEIPRSRDERAGEPERPGTDNRAADEQPGAQH